MSTMLPPRHGPAAWEQSTLLPDDGIYRLDEQCVQALHDTAACLERDPLPTDVLNPEDFELDRAREAMRTVRESLETGIGFAIIDRVPLDGLDDIQRLAGDRAQTPPGPDLAPRPGKTHVSRLTP